MKALNIAIRLLYQNRWLYLVLILSPFGLAWLLHFAAGSLDPSDVLAVMHQECIYGLALVIFTGSAQLGNEQRSRRIATVLSRAVSRREYILSLVLGAYLPLVPYAASFALAGIGLARATPSLHGVAIGMAAALVLLGVWMAAVSVFFAVLLPQILASTATLAVLAGTAAMGQIWPGFRLGRILVQLSQGSLVDEANLLRAHPGWLLAPLIASAAFLFAAAEFFERRDLSLTSE